MNPTLQAAEAQLSVQQRFRIALARSRRLLARTFDESQHPRDEHGQWTDGSGGSGGGADDVVVAYHGSTAEVAKKIAAEGIKVRRGKTYANNTNAEGQSHYHGERGQSVYITSDRGEAMRFAAGRAQKLKDQKKRQHDVVVFKMQMPRAEWDKLQQDEEHETAKRAAFIDPKYFSEYRIYHDKARWDEEYDPNLYDESAFELAKIVRLKAADDVTTFMSFVVDDEAKYKALADQWRIARAQAQALLAREFDESKHPRVPAGSPDGGQFGSGGGADAAADIPDSALDPKVVEVGGDAWNKATARRLEREYQKAKPALEAIAFNETPAAQVGEDPLDEQLAGTEDDEDHDPDKDDDYAPDEWDSMTSHDQDTAGQQYYEKELSHYVQSEEDNWINNGGQLDDTKAQLASDDEWRLDAIKDWLTGEGDDGDKNTDLKYPYTPEQLADATLINYESDGEGNGKVKVQFVDQKLDEPIGAPPKEQGTLPGIAPENMSQRLTAEMRTELKTMLIAEFNKHAEDNASDTQPPDYLTDQAKEYMEENWEHNMSDSEKFDYVKKATDILDKAEAPSEVVLGLPNHYDPLNETSGVDYKRTQVLARKMSLQRAEQVMKDRKIEFAPGFDKRALGRIDGELWSAWKGSSTSKEGQLLQVATADELGGRLNPKTGIGGKVELSPESIKSWAEVNYKSIGGYAGVKAYVRAKWETTQFLLDKAGLSELQLYRGITLDTDKLAQAYQEKWFEQKQMVNGFAKVPNLNVVRNGAASTSVKASISNGWGSGTNRLVLRASVPRTAAISVPAYGINVQSEQEVVVAGTAWKQWDAWLDKAPEFHEVAMAA